MFNQSPFNHVHYNREYTVAVFASAHLSGEGEMLAHGTVDLSAAAQLTGMGLIDAEYIREIFMDTKMNGTGLITATMLRDRTFAVTLSGEGTMTAAANRYNVKFITFSGAFDPGDQIVIDMDKFKVTLNGDSALKQISGDFFSLAPGDNELTYEDSEGSRTVRIRISNTDRFL